MRVASLAGKQHACGCARSAPARSLPTALKAGPLVCGRAFSVSEFCRRTSPLYSESASSGVIVVSGVIDVSGVMVVSGVIVVSGFSLIPIPYSIAPARPGQLVKPAYRGWRAESVPAIVAIS